MEYQEISQWLIDSLFLTIFGHLVKLPSLITVVSLFAGFLGLFIGSFINVVALRTVRKTNWVTGTSECFSCGRKLPFYRNLPIVGYLMNFGKSSCCNKKIPCRYVFVELLTGVMFLTVFTSVPLYPAIAVSIGLSLAIIGSLIDLEIMEIPHTINFLIFLSMLSGFVLYTHDYNILNILKSEAYFFLGALSFFGFLYLILRKAAFGFGDVFLLMAFLPMLGISGLLGAIQVGYILLASFLLFKVSIKKEMPTAMPMVPWLALGWWLVFISKIG